MELLNRLLHQRGQQQPHNVLNSTYKALFYLLLFIVCSSGRVNGVTAHIATLATLPGPITSGVASTRAHCAMLNYFQRPKWDQLVLGIPLHALETQELQPTYNLSINRSRPSISITPVDVDSMDRHWIRRDTFGSAWHRGGIVGVFPGLHMWVRRATNLHGFKV